jgi:hypothetical protein
MFALLKIDINFKFPTKIMVWGAISVHGPSRLYIVEGIMYSHQYVNMLDRRLKPQIREWFPDGQDWIFLQDSAPCHVSKSGFANNEVELLEWPGNSPDTNPIENVWKVLKNEIHEQPITNRVELIARLIQVWFDSPRIAKMYRSLIEGMARRVEALVKAKGGQTKYYD